MKEITGVTFKDGGKVYYFQPERGARYEKGKGVVVETSRGVEYAKVVIPYAEVDDNRVVAPLKPVLRAATQRDEETYLNNQKRKEEAMQTVRERIAHFNLDMKLIDCEFAFDGNKSIFYYSAPQRVDFRELVKDLSSIFHMRIELHQVGIRDEIKMYGGLAPCGRECCCSSCLPEFNKVSIKMAKNQGLSLNPGKISGLCGKLMCCLAYENDYYSEACKQMPKIGATVATPDGAGTVVNLNMLKMEVRVRIDDKERDMFTYKDYPVSALGEGAQSAVEPDDEPDDEPELEELQEKPQQNNNFKKKHAQKGKREGGQAEKQNRPQSNERREHNQFQGGERHNRSKQESEKANIGLPAQESEKREHNRKRFIRKGKGAGKKGGGENRNGGNRQENKQQS